MIVEGYFIPTRLWFNGTMAVVYGHPRFWCDPDEPDGQQDEGWPLGGFPLTRSDRGCTLRPVTTAEHE